MATYMGPSTISSSNYRQKCDYALCEGIEVGSEMMFTKNGKTFHLECRIMIRVKEEVEKAIARFTEAPLKRWLDTHYEK